MKSSEETVDNPAPPQPQPTPTPAGTVHWGFSMSLDGFVAGPGHSMRSQLVEA